MKDILLPELAESITEGTIGEWLKQEGDYVTKGDAIVEIETDKTNVEIHSEHNGVISEILFQPGDDVEVGQIIARIDDSKSEQEAGESKSQTDEPSSEEAKEKEIEETEDVDSAKEDEQEEDTAQSKDTSSNYSDSKNEGSSERKHGPIASPAARKKARELGIDLNEIPYQDPLGRIRASDIEHYKKESNKAQETTEEKEHQTEPTEIVRMSRRRQTIAKRLVEVQHQSAMLTTFNEVDMTAIMEFRNRKKEVFYEKHGIKLGFMSFFTKAVVAALKQFPYINSEINENDLHLKKFYHIGIAVSTDEGLVVPVVRHADKRSFAQLEADIAGLSEKARNNSLELKDLQGGTFTITNGGVFGSLYSTPILNMPQVGILGMHKIQKRPIAIDDEKIEVRPMMYIALSYDHRVIDGKDSVQFLVKIKELLEDPEQLLLEL